jgi:hypothetical protein
MSKFVSGCQVVCKFSDGKVENFLLKEKLTEISGGLKWVASDRKGLLRVILEKEMFKLGKGKIKIGDYAYNAISSSVTLINEDDDLIYVNENYYKVQNYKENKHESHNT